MDSKKKIIISVTTFVIALVAIIVAVVSVLAATNVSITSSIKVTYTVSDVVADVAVSAAKVKTNATSITWGTASTKDFGINYTGTGETITLTDMTLLKDECIVLKFVFNNNGAKAFTATLTKPSGTNVNIYYATSESALLASTTATPTAVNVASGADKSGTYFAVIKIADATQNAAFDGSFIWNLA